MERARGAGTHRGLSARDRLGDDRFLDVHYNDLTADPVAEVTRIHEHFGIQVDDETVRRVRDFADGNPQGKHGAHQYTPEQFGFAPSASAAASRPTRSGSVSSPTARGRERKAR